MSFFSFGSKTAAAPEPTSPSTSPPPSPAQSDAEMSHLKESFGSMISGAKDRIASKLHPTVPDDGIEYIFIDENPLAPKKKERPAGHFGPLPMRTVYDKLNYGTGVAYVFGLSVGGMYGAIRGLQIAPGNSYKIRVNSLLNTATRYGPWAANSLGILTMGWALTDNLMQSVRGVSDYYNHISAAFLTGLIFKSTAGIRPALLAGSIMASVVSLYGLQENFGRNPPKLTMPELEKQKMM
ncbi:Mitochondrial import inner membrane translocase subunit tim23 [Phlyctochytrium planicorne]|nr:Mitochondrial import inner membrane translocase subunit tim23 [Phlyctochytrium planicorne]